MDKLKTFMMQRIVAGTLLAVAILWLFSTIMGILNKPISNSQMENKSHLLTTTPLIPAGSINSAVQNNSNSASDSHNGHVTGKPAVVKPQQAETSHASAEVPAQQKESVAVSMSQETSPQSSAIP